MTACSAATHYNSALRSWISALPGISALGAILLSLFGGSAFATNEVPNLQINFPNASLIDFIKFYRELAPPIILINEPFLPWHRTITVKSEAALTTNQMIALMEQAASAQAQLQFIHLSDGLALITLANQFGAYFGLAGQPASIAAPPIPLQKYSAAQWVRFCTESRPSTNRDEAALAVVQLGPKAEPYLIQGLQARESRLHARFYATMPGAIQKHLLNPADRLERRRRCAEWLSYIEPISPAGVHALVTAVTGQNPLEYPLAYAELQSLRTIAWRSCAGFLEVAKYLPELKRLSQNARQLGPHKAIQSQCKHLVDTLQAREEAIQPDLQSAPQRRRNPNYSNRSQVDHYLW